MSATTTIVGNVGADPEISLISRGESKSTKAKFRIATNTYRKGATGEWEIANTLWVTVEAWNKLADACKYLKKGAPIIAIGTLLDNSWTNKAGEKVAETLLRAEHIGLDIGRVDGVAYKSKERNEPGESDSVA
jgi:single-strand DNA-binding protein